MYKIITALRDGELHRADDLAHKFGVTSRTIYRDMERLNASGIDIQGTPGSGYRCAATISLPMLNLTTSELEVLHLGLAVIGESAEPDLRNAAFSLSQKIDAVLSEDSQISPQAFGFALYPFAEAARGFQYRPVIRAAIRSRQKLEVMEIGGAPEIVRPLSLDYWGRVWNCLCWSESVETFATFRLDLISKLSVLPELFVDEPEKTHMDYRAKSPAITPPAER